MLIACWTAIGCVILAALFVMFFLTVIKNKTFHSFIYFLIGAIFGFIGGKIISVFLEKIEELTYEIKKLK